MWNTSQLLSSPPSTLFLSINKTADSFPFSSSLQRKCCSYYLSWRSPSESCHPGGLESWSKDPGTALIQELLKSWLWIRLFKAGCYSTFNNLSVSLSLCVSSMSGWCVWGVRPETQQATVQNSARLWLPCICPAKSSVYLVDPARSSSEQTDSDGAAKKSWYWRRIFSH